MTVLDVAAAGVVLWQDLGRPEGFRWGIACSGAADRAAMRRANRIVGNDESAAVLEVTGGLVVNARQRTTLAVAGADAPLLVDSVSAATECALDLEAGQTLSIGVPSRGLRSYVAVRGGFVVDAVQGSRSYDTLGGLGPPPVTAGDVLVVGTAPAAGPVWRERMPVPTVAGTVELRIAPGPHAGWLEESAGLAAEPWTVSAAADRVGLRLEGRALPRRPGEIEPVPLLPGCVQLPPDGRPIVLGPDAGTTGGYPIIACVVEPDLDLLAQCRPGDGIRFVAIP